MLDVEACNDCIKLATGAVEVAARTPPDETTFIVWPPQMHHRCVPGIERMVQWMGGTMGITIRFPGDDVE